ncbi:hypothetical protein [Clostridium sporogenes]|uniref:hypothetical protein n=1 Tax=Clostridium sporogenes TaxID=1509 RepID=UPI00024BAC8A|nr:hypothetical protein [Clostridium sporogenes]EHN15497.1 hypothetical protein IYC_08488 [Clostridium sporogenes PA 3679]MDU4597739.1 hypothetical protein [Clostridium sporogenes]NFQ34628.1 hypothetical protein [Clostridium sporogenes]NFQ59035.1 hypothetical protein [Clostridium sporogenes]NFU09250.1 hypothetical protein [Clostridium sporogenes]
MLKLLLVVSTINVVLNIIGYWMAKNKIEKISNITTSICWLITGTLAFIFI